MMMRPASSGMKSLDSRSSSSKKNRCCQNSTLSKRGTATYRRSMRLPSRSIGLYWPGLSPKHLIGLLWKKSRSCFVGFESVSSYWHGRLRIAGISFYNIFLVKAYCLFYKHETLWTTNCLCWVKIVNTAWCLCTIWLFCYRIFQLVPWSGREGARSLCLTSFRIRIPVIDSPCKVSLCLAY